MKSGPYWTCPEKKLQQMRRYRATEKGKASNARFNAKAEARSSKQLYELTRVKMI